jgi:hypothetical protein
MAGRGRGRGPRRGDEDNRDRGDREREQHREREPEWPSLDEQLARAHAPPGSPLAELIAANQDFSILRPEEAHDNLKLPPWLRVHYRRSHPEGDYSASNPSGGYPQFARTALEWMMLHPDLPVQQGSGDQNGPAERGRDRGE